MTRRFATLAKGLLLASAVTAAAERHAAAAPMYSVTDVGDLIFPAMNDAGQVVGRRYIRSDSTKGSSLVPTGLLYSNGTLTDLGTGFIPYSINNSGQIAGLAITSPTTGEAAVRDPDGTQRILGPFRGYPTDSLSINSSGQVAVATSAAAQIYSADGKTMNTLSFAAPNETLKPHWTAGIGISDSGRVAGAVFFPESQTRALFYTGSDGLGHPYGPGVESGAPDTSFWTITHNGTILAGNFIFSPETGQTTHIKYPDDPPGNLYRTFGLNDAGVVVGWVHNDQTGLSSGYVYKDDKLTDLNDVIPQASDIHIESAYGINDNGQILAQGYFHNSNGWSQHTLLLTPVNTPEPSTIVIFAAGLLALRFGRKKAA